MNKIFITGVCGFVGFNLANYFQSSGYRVYGIDNLSRKGTEKNLKLLRNNGVKVFQMNYRSLKDQFGHLIVLQHHMEKMANQKNMD